MASIRTLSEKIIKTFYLSVIDPDVQHLFGDIEYYVESYEAMYHPARALSLERLDTVMREVTYYIKLLHVSYESHYKAEQFKTRIYDVSAELLDQIAKADTILKTFDDEYLYSDLLFSKGDHWDFKPTRLFESKKSDDDCNGFNGLRSAIKYSMESMKTKVMELKDYLDANWNNITDETIVNNASSNTYTVGSVDVLDLMSDLHRLSLHLTGKSKQYQSCLSSYYHFINSVKKFREANTYSKDQEYLSGIQFDAEVKQSELIRTKGVLDQLEIEIAQNIKKKQKIGEQINATFVTAMEKKTGISQIISNYRSVRQDRGQDKGHENQHVEELHNSLGEH